MTAPKHTPRPERLSALLLDWIEARADETAVRWLKEAVQDVGNAAPDWRFFTTFSAVPRHLGKEDLHLSNHELAKANSERPGWNPSRWSVDQAGRAALVVSLPHENVAPYVATLDKLFSSADVRESVALYQCLLLLAHPDQFTRRAAEGVRSNVTSVFDAVALDNPYPAEYLSDDAWNQMVLKAVFVGSSLSRIHGLDRRANPDLARMLVDFARERRAASRPVEPELWRPVGPFVDERFIEDVHAALNSDRADERKAAALALSASVSESGVHLLEGVPELKQQIDRGELTWSSFARS